MEYLFLDQGKNLHFTSELEHNSPPVMLWTGVDVNYKVGLHFFEKHVIGRTYMGMLWDRLIPQLTELGVMNQVWLLQDGTVHFMLTVHNFLFPGRWISSGWS